MRPEYIVGAQQVAGLLLAFLSAGLLTRVRREWPRWTWATSVLVVILLAWFGNTFWVYRYTAVQSAEREWVQRRADWVNGQIEKQIGDAKAIRYAMLAVHESDVPYAQKLAKLRETHTPLLDKWRDGAMDFLKVELPGTRVETLYDYDFGFGAGTTEWNIAILSGTVRQLIDASNAMETLVARSKVPRTHEPDLPYKWRARSQRLPQ